MLEGGATNDGGRAARERAIFWSAAIVCAATRVLAVSRSLWEWDEAQFALAMRDYDVGVHHPHPPGFPAFIAMANVVRLIATSDFRALQAISVTASLLVFPAVFCFARTLRVPFNTSVIAGVLFAFFPNVWFFGGTAFSDIPSIVLVLFAVVCLLRGAEHRDLYWLGALLLGIAAGIRPQNLLVGLFPALYASWKRRFHEVVIAALIGGIIVGAAFGGAIYASGSFDRYVQAVREHADYISRVDSWRSEARPALWRLTDRFFVKQYQSPALSFLVTIFVLVSLAGTARDRDRAMLFNLLTFGPFAIFAWLMLDRFSISRFSIGYQPMFALLAADGIRRVAKSRERVEAAIAAVIVIAFAVYTIPALNVVRTTFSPTVQVMEAVKQHVDPARDALYVGHTMSKFPDLLAPEIPYRRVIDDRAMPLSQRERAWLLAEVNRTREEGFVFRRERNSLWNIARHHYFTVALKPLRDVPQFGDGWYGPEGEDIHEWRWMSGRSTLLLPPASGRTMLRIHIGIPGETLDSNPEVTVTLNGQVVDRFRATRADMDRDIRVTPAPPSRPNVLELSIDKTVIPANAGTGADRRTLGLRLRYLGWGPA